MQKCFLTQFTTFLIMNELLIAHDYIECFKVFEVYMSSLGDVNAKSMNSFKENSNKLNYVQFRLACMSLLCLNTKESFSRMKTLIVSNMHDCNAFLSDKLLISCFLLAFLQV